MIWRLLLIALLVALVLALLVAILGTGPLAAEAQQAAKIARIAFCRATGLPIPHLPEDLRQGLRDLGYVEAATS